jgi:membrane-associated phospholipid phosphatase
MQAISGVEMRGERLTWRGRLLREVLVVGIAYFIYSQVRGLAGDRTVDAFRNAYKIVNIERDLGIFKELALQALILPHDLLVAAANMVYFYGLFPLIIPTALFLFIRRPPLYVVVRNAFLASGFIAVVFYLSLPTAPPRLLSGMGFVDTLGRSLTPSYSSLPGVNHFAALPSMHVGWNFLTALAIYWALRGFRFRWAAWLLPAAMVAATVATGNHYFIDGALGIMVALGGVGVALLIERRGLRRRAAAAMGEPAPVAPA